MTLSLRRWCGIKKKMTASNEGAAYLFLSGQSP